MDELKNYFRKHEAEMQVETPDESGMWERLKEKQQQRPKRAVMMAMQFAAAACILLLVGLGIRQWITGDTEPTKRMETVKNSGAVKKEFVPLPDNASEEKQTVIARLSEEKSQPQPVRMQPVKKAQPDVDGYTELVNDQLERLRRTPVYAETPEFFSEFSQQLQQMEADEALLQKDIQTYGLNQQLLEALLTISQQKLSLLEGLQKEINKMNVTVKKTRSATSLHPYYLNL